MHPLTRMDAMRMALDACADDPEFRRSLAPDGELPAHLLDRLAERLQPARVTSRARRRFVGGRRPIMQDQLDQARRLDELGPATPLRRRPTVIATLEPLPDGVTLMVRRLIREGYLLAL
jgi:hypothetical protein